MSTIPPVSPVRSEVVPTSRLRTHALSVGRAPDPLVVLIHGNVSSACFFAPLLQRLGNRWRAVALDLRGFGRSETKAVDATRGVRDFADDLHAYLEESIPAADRCRAHLVGWSMGAGVVAQYAIDHPAQVASITLLSPMSPYGFAATKDLGGTPCWEDYSGSGGGTAHSDLVARLANGDRSTDSETSPRRVLTSLYMRPSNHLDPELIESLVTGMLSTVIGEANYPGEPAPSPNWPFTAPGERGVVNALSPKYCKLDALADIEPRPPVLWVRGADDQIVSDTSLIDLGYLGQLGLVAGWPGPEVFPPQPMVSQTTAVLDRYQQAGGRVEEVVLPDCGHSPHLEKPDLFYGILSAFLETNR